MPATRYPPSPGAHPPSPEELTEQIAAAAEWFAHTSRELDAARWCLFRLLDARRAAGPHQEAVCGTPAGYHRHRREHTVPCPACAEARSWEQRHHAGPRPIGRPPLPREHGTDRGYHQHRTHGDPFCDDCREAHAQVERERQRVRRRAA